MDHRSTPETILGQMGIDGDDSWDDSWGRTGRFPIFVSDDSPRSLWHQRERELPVCPSSVPFSSPVFLTVC